MSRNLILIFKELQFENFGRFNETSRTDLKWDSNPTPTISSHMLLLLSYRRLLKSLTEYQLKLFTALNSNFDVIGISNDFFLESTENLGKIFV